MANIFDYIKWRGDLDFNASPFNPVDSIILSQLSYLTLDSIVPGPEDKDSVSVALAVRIYEEKINSAEGLKLTSVFKEDPELIRALGASERFGNCHLFGFVNKFDAGREIQFSALCVYTGDGSCYIAFRGTDASLIGWKEDFNMSFREVIPSQLEAGYYLEKMSPLINGSLRVGGHSKGGNLAIYAASTCGKHVQKRITDIYANDSPGFHENFLSHSGYAAVKDRIRIYVPQSSVIGMLLNHKGDHTVIKSSQSGIMQHNLYSWEVAHNDLIRAEKTTTSSRFINKTLREWLNNVDSEQREDFIEALYHILTAAEVSSFQELEKSWFEAVGKLFKSLGQIDESKRKIIRNTLKELFICAGRNIETFIKQKTDD